MCAGDKNKENNFRRVKDVYKGQKSMYLSDENIENMINDNGKKYLQVNNVIVLYDIAKDCLQNYVCVFLVNHVVARAPIYQRNI